MTTHTTLLSCVTRYNLITFRWYKYNNITVSSQISFGAWMGYKKSFEDGLHSMRSFLSFPPPPPSPSPPQSPPLPIFFFAHPRRTPSLAHFFARFVRSPPGKGKETTATQAMTKIMITIIKGRGLRHLGFAMWSNVKPFLSTSLSPCVYTHVLTLLRPNLSKYISYEVLQTSAALPWLV